ncbi:MAG: threonine-phosphate decarboxylase CobD [Marivita sp.]|uniref:threonine-phosphate decarboxylase CobD n=1 Tax=Marivita sp. TaxID=2003365 RepID=UPI003EFA03D2
MTPRDHGGGLDAARKRYGGDRGDWIDLSTGINPVPYPVDEIAPEAWTALPDQGAQDRLIAAARRFWSVPDKAVVVAAPGASALIARMPELTARTDVTIPGPTYNEHEAAFRAAGAAVNDPDALPAVRVLVHPNNPDGRTVTPEEVRDAHRDLTIIDESFCDVLPERSVIALTDQPGIVVLKSFGKFWGLAGLRLGFAIGAPKTLARVGRGSEQVIDLETMLGPWPVSGPALQIGARALEDANWADATRDRLAKDAARLDAMVSAAGARCLGGTDLFRLYEVGDAARWQDRLAQNQIWSRIFPYSTRWLRLGLPAPDQWDRVAAAISDAPR